MHGVSKDEIFVFAHEYANEDKNLHPDIASIANGSFLHKNSPKIIATGYVSCSLEAALWAFAKSDNFRDGVLIAVTSEMMQILWGLFISNWQRYSGV